MDAHVPVCLICGFLTFVDLIVSLCRENRDLLIFVVLVCGVFTSEAGRLV